MEHGVLTEIENKSKPPVMGRPDTDMLAGTGGIKPAPVESKTASTGVLTDPLSRSEGTPTVPTTPLPTEPIPTYEATTNELGPDQLVSGNMANIFDEGGVLMDVARSTGDEYSNARGGLNSSMGAGDSMRAMIDAALPIASQDAAAQVSQLQTNQAYENDASKFNATSAIQERRDSILQGYNIDMENLDTTNTASLINLEQEWGFMIQRNADAAAFYGTGMEQIGAILSNGDLSVDQQIAGVTSIVGEIDAFLSFTYGLDNIDSTGGGTGGAGADGGITSPTPPTTISELPDRTSTTPTFDNNNDLDQNGPFGSPTGTLPPNVNGVRGTKYAGDDMFELTNYNGGTMNVPSGSDKAWWSTNVDIVVAFNNN